MKFFHLSDLHIGLKLFNRELYDDQCFVFAQIISMATKERPDAIVIAGDIYDKATPSAEAVELFDGFISALREAVPGCSLMLISGNHDSAPRVNVFRRILCHQGLHMIGLPPQNENEHIEKLVLRDSFGPVNFYLLPFVRPSMVKGIVGSNENGNNLSYDASLHKLIERDAPDMSERNVLVSHQFYVPVSVTADSVERMDSEYRSVGNIDAVRADILELFDYAALGHIHKPMKLGRGSLRYCGTPLACSVSEAGQDKGIVMVELGEKGDVRTSVLPLAPLHRVRVISGTLDEVLAQACDDYVSIVLGDELEYDALDLQDRLRSAFPNLLETRRSFSSSVDYSHPINDDEELDPYELCSAFLGDLSDDDASLLMDVINSVKEAEG